MKTTVEILSGVVGFAPAAFALTAMSMKAAAMR
jgi:hypothetical protein